MSNELRPNFRLRENDATRCAKCTMVAYNDAQAAYCMAGAPGKAPEEGQRVNENFVCDNFSAR